MCDDVARWRAFAALKGFRLERAEPEGILVRWPGGRTAAWYGWLSRDGHTEADWWRVCFTEAGCEFE